MIIDTHVHYNLDGLFENWKQYWKEAQEHGVVQSIIVGADTGSNIRGNEISQQDNNLFCAVGFHPTDAKESDLALLEQLITTNKKVVAIGECGLDYHRLPKDVQQATQEKNIQKKLFGQQIQLAKKHDLPLIIHSRDSYPDILDVINHFSKDDGNTPKAVLHCMSGPIEYLKQALDLGFYISFAGNVTFSNAPELRELALLVPLDRLFLETDAPFLAPQPLRGQYPNHPKNILEIAKLLATLYNIDREKFCLQTTENARRFFGLPNPD